MTSVTATELAKGLSDILNRIHYQGESFIVERNGQAIATISALNLPAAPHPTWSEVIGVLGDMALPDSTFADDLELIQAAQPPMETPRWER